jgi:hypothetical protein
MERTLAGTVAAVVAPDQTPFRESHFSRRTSKLVTVVVSAVQETSAVPPPLSPATTLLGAGGAGGAGGGTSGVFTLVVLE